MTTYVFGFVEPGAALPPLLRRVPGPGVDAVVGEPAAGDAREALLRHGEVLQRLLASTAVVPARFGSAVTDDAALERLMTERAAGLRAALGRVRGRVELAVRAAWASSPPPRAEPAPTSGREWLLRKAADAEAARRLRSRVDSPLTELAADGRWASPSAPGGPATAAYLVDSVDVEAFTARARQLAADPELVLTCTGPWPPYSFVDLADVDLVDEEAAR
jgi:gas vesicle protein GvpL/GvpF